MASDLFKIHGFSVFSFFALFAIGGANTALSDIPDSIQLPDELPAHSQISSSWTPVRKEADARIVQVQYLNGPAMEEAENDPVMIHPVAFSTAIPKTESQVSSDRTISDSSVVPVSANAPVPVNPVPMNAPVQAEIPAYVPDGTVLEAEEAIEEYAGLPAPVPGLFLADFCAPVCAPCGSGILGPGCLFVEGYLAQGFNVNSNSTSYSEPVGTYDKEGYQLNQLYLSVGRRICRGDQWAVGGQVDIMFGTDYYYMTSTGLETDHNNQPHWNGKDLNRDHYRAGREMYGMALPQAFLEAYVPILAGVDVKVGHFNSVMGFEANQANQNFFYSRSYTSIYGVPTSMTGVMTEWHLNDVWSITAGAVNEWNAFDTPEDHFSYVLGVNYQNPCQTFAVSATVMGGKQCAASFQADDYSHPGANTTVFDLCAKFKLTDRLAYVVEFNYGNNDAEVYDILAASSSKGRNWYGFSNYLFWQLSNTLTLGARFEWFCDKENTVISGGHQTTFANMGVNYFNWTLGLNWDPCPWLTIRPEMRWDYSDMELDVNGQKFYAYDRNSANYQFTLGCDAIIRF
ncbi:MAG: porin [Thermoguttaceae bacterium]|nr:porin [Thermoguttaceae bacterium]